VKELHASVYMQCVNDETSRVGKGKGNVVLLQASTGPEGSRKLRFPHFVMTQDGSR